MDLVPDRQLGATVSSPFTASRATLASKAGLCFLRPWDISHSYLAATAALSLGAGLSLSYPSSFLGPPQKYTNRDGGHWEIQDLETCRCCTAQEWITNRKEGRQTETRWYVSRPTEHHTLAFWPAHAESGRKMADELKEKIDSLISQVLDNERAAQKRAVRMVGVYGPPGGQNPPGIYSQRTLNGWPPCPAARRGYTGA